MIWILALTNARAERPLTYAEAMQAATAANGALIVSGYARDQSVGAVRAAQGIFDPLYTLEASHNRSRAQGFFQGFPFSSTSSGWNLLQSLTGDVGTGTSYAVNLDIQRDQEEFATNFGTGGVVTGTAPQVQDAFRGNLSATVTQQLLKGIRFRYNVQNVTLAREAVATAELAYAKQQQDTLYLAAEAYWNWVYQSELNRNALESVAVAEEALRVGRLQVERGKLAPVEATRLEAAEVQARQLALDAGNLAESAANTLLLTMGESPDQAVIPATLPGDVPPVELDPVSVARVAAEQNIDLLLARQTLETSRIDWMNAKHGLLPSLAASATAGVGSQRCARGTTDADCVVGNAVDALTGLAASDNQPYVVLSGVFSVPIGNRASRGLRDISASVVAQRERELADLERAVAAQVEEQVRALQSAGQRMELADANVRLAVETLAAEEALAEAGRSIQKDVLEARSAVQASKSEAAKARTDYRLAQALLLKLQGQLTAQSP